MGDSIEAKIRTVVRSETNHTFDVVLKRNGREVKSKRLKRDGDSQLKYTMGVANGKNGKQVDVELEITGYDTLDPERTATCKYDVFFQRKEATWSGNIANIKKCFNGIKLACADCTLECSKEFLEGRNNWTTTFTISD